MAAENLPITRQPSPPFKVGATVWWVVDNPGGPPRGQEGRPVSVIAIRSQRNCGSGWMVDTRFGWWDSGWFTTTAPR